ncbi:helix-turn-helix domain-containing protein [Nocardiopsis sp. FR4]|uniref:helix-turn-helix domain-containing protein n=1 Tax=Nocardiopsis sp. FR4 TaxID=2605985 RepID=UPI00135A2D3F|nr:helix-turn-helix domain-containing protein [Nocardiopsis sp. FR4]
MRAIASGKRKAVKAKHVEIRETFMRYRVVVTRVQAAERYVRATDEEDAVQKVREEFDRPYGYFGSWKTTGSEVEVVGVEETVVIKQPHPLSPEGPLLLSLKDVGKALGLSYSTVYELVSRGEIEHVMVGSRKYISRDALAHFITQNTHRGYHR